VVETAGTWQPLTNQPSAHKPSSFNVSTMLLLTDGMVMCQDAVGGVGTNHWWRLSPDAHGSYVNGAWAPLDDMKHARTYYASAVLADGRVLAAGGEFGDNGAKTYQNFVEIYDPDLDDWSDLTAPTGWTQIGDAACCVLANGNVLIGTTQGNQTAIYNPRANTWTAAGAGGAKLDLSDEESWVLLPDGSVVTVQCFVGQQVQNKAEKYLPASDKWVSAGSLPVALVDTASNEIGPGVLLADGRAFFVGGTGNTALYTPPANSTQAGAWRAGPTFPKDSAGTQMKAKDAPGCLLPNGKVLCVAGPDNAQGWSQPTNFFEFDPTTNKLTELAKNNQPANNKGVTYEGRLLVLPTGEAIFANGTSTLYVYQPDGRPQPAWKPTIASVPTRLVGGQAYPLTGRQLNGLSQASMYGDDASAATNYPLVRLRLPETGQVWYCKTSNHSTMGVATGQALVSTSFRVPFGIGVFDGELTVVANGIASDPVKVSVHAPDYRQVLREYDLWQTLIGSLAGGPLWVLPPGQPPTPIPPWGDPAWRKEATLAYRQIGAGMDTLRAIGEQVIAGRLKQRADPGRLKLRLAEDRRLAPKGP
jgi:hypothetical protein